MTKQLESLPQGWEVKQQLTLIELVRHSINEYAKVASPEVTIGVLRDEIERLEKLMGGDGQ